jgi:hypothetical protein
LAEPDDDPPPLGALIDRFDMEIVEFVLSWAPYGGPPEDECVPRFGMPRDRLMARFGGIVCHGRRENLTYQELALLARAATLPIPAEPRPRPHRADDMSAAIGKPVLRRGVWRWA